MKTLTWISDHLLQCVVVVGAFALCLPELGTALAGIVSPVLAIMVFCISLTIKMEDLGQIKRYPVMILWSTFLQFIPMALFSLLLGKIASQSADITTGQLLLGSLPADISAPLMVYLVGGNTALATAMLVMAMALTPVVLPWMLSFFGNVAVQIPTSYLIIELAGIIVVPVILGVCLNYQLKQVREREQVWSGAASLCYLILLFVVVSSNAHAIVSLKAAAFLLVFVEIALNLFGYSLAYLTKLVFKQEETFIPLLFLVGSKEFGIASAVVDTMRISPAIVIPSAFYAVIQMISLPIMVKIIKTKKMRRQAAKPALVTTSPS